MFARSSPPGNHGSRLPHYNRHAPIRSCHFCPLPETTGAPLSGAPGERQSLRDDEHRSREEQGVGGPDLRRRIPPAVFVSSDERVYAPLLAPFEKGRHKCRRPVFVR